MATHVQTLTNTDLLGIFTALADKPYTLFLDSADLKHTDARYSFLAFDPVEIITMETCKTADPFTHIQNRINHWNEQLQPETHPNLPPFQGGAAGLFSYDLGRTIEDLPNTATPSPCPDLAIGIYNKVIAIDHTAGQAWFITHGEQCAPPETDSTPAETTALNWNAQFTATEYKSRIQKVIDYIHAGDIFQANLSQRFTANLPDGFKPAAHYLHLRNINPAPFSGYMNLGNTQISSASPERFLNVTNNNVHTKPIKGTAPITSNPQDLLSSTKDRAENIMIVDLLRNDLSKTCKAESINVPKLCTLESFASVHHLVSTVTGTLQDGRTALDLLRASFPGGSITGAPKIRAQEIIEELEEQRRGAYCGSLGYIDFNGDMDTNILIRTLIYSNNEVTLNVGGGITANSKPRDEYQETLDKAEGLFNSFKEQLQKSIYPS